jgi:hypothetical protein
MKKKENLKKRINQNHLLSKQLNKIGKNRNQKLEQEL